MLLLLGNLTHTSCVGVTVLLMEAICLILLMCSLVYVIGAGAIYQQNLIKPKANLKIKNSILVHCGKCSVSRQRVHCSYTFACWSYTCVPSYNPELSIVLSNYCQSKLKQSMWITKNKLTITNNNTVKYWINLFGKYLSRSILDTNNKEKQLMKQRE